MKIDKLLYEHFAEFRLRGEFDTFYAPKLGEEVDRHLATSAPYLVLDLRLVKFINSTALGAIIKAHKRTRAEGGELVIAQPSPFCHDVLTKVGIDRIVPMFDDIDEARQHLTDRMLEQDTPQVIGESNVLFSFADGEKPAAMGEHGTGLGTVLSVDHEGIRFRWDGGYRELDGNELRSIFVAGTELRTKFQIKLCKKGFFDVASSVEDVEIQHEDERYTAYVRARFVGLGEPDRLALAQFADDLDYLKRQIDELDGR